MKRILALVLLAVFLSANAFAQAVDQAGNRSTATLGDQDSNKNYRITTDTTGLVQFANDTSIAYPYENVPGRATAYALSSADSGLLIVDWGGISSSTPRAATLTTGAGGTYTLPACTSLTLGFNYNVITAVADTITVTPSTTADSIEYSVGGNLGTGSVPQPGQGLKNSSKLPGDRIGLSCQSPGQWIVSDVGGTITLAP